MPSKSKYMEINIKKTISGFPLKIKARLETRRHCGWTKGWNGTAAETGGDFLVGRFLFSFSPPSHSGSVFSFSLCLSISISVFPLSHHARVVLYNIIVISSVRGLRRMAAARKCAEENKFNEISVLLHF